MSTVGLLHPGVMGSAIGREIRRNGYPVLWCAEGRSAATRERAQRAGLRVCQDLSEMLGQCTVVLSICPPAAAEEVAQRVVDAGYRGIFADANAVSPETLHRIANRVSASGSSFVDASIIGPPPRQRQAKTRLYVSGAREVVGGLSRLVSGTAVEPVWLGEEPGQASALKMAFASYQKASRVLAAVAHALADEHGVTDALVAEAERMPGKILAQRDYLPSVAGRAWRWGPEMHEVARTLNAASLPPDLAVASAVVLARWNEDRGESELPISTVLAQLRKRV